MGGKGETSELRIQPTQDQLRLARITQEISSVDEDKTNVPKLIKKVVETTRCTVEQAEFALYDADYNVEDAVNAILEQSYPEENVWKEQKSRRVRRAEAEEKADEIGGAQRSRMHTPRITNGYVGTGRGRGSERGRGNFRAVTRGGGRGAYLTKGSHQQFVMSYPVSTSNNNHWDNALSSKTEALKEWTISTSNTVEDIPEDTDWKTAGTLVFSRRDEPPAPPSSDIVNASTVSTNTSSVSGPISFAAVAAAAASKTKESLPAHSASPASTLSSNVRLSSPASSQNHVCPTTGRLLEASNSLYQNSDIVSSSNAVVSSRAVAEKEVVVSSSSMSTTVHSQSSPSASGVIPPQSSPVSDPVANTPSNDWTAQLKNDLGIGGRSAASAVAQSPVQHTGQPKKIASPRTVNARQSTHPSYTVEFVSGDSSSSPGLPEYQFGFHIDSANGNDDSEGQSFSSTTTGRTATAQPVKSEVELLPAATSSTLANGVVGAYPSISSQHQVKSTITNGNIGISTASTVSHASSMNQQRQPQLGLSYADTSSMSYPSPDSRTSSAKVITSLHHQQQQQAHQLYTAAQIPYSSYPYLNMYSPVTGVRQEEAQYAATLMQYPFGVGQFDMTSLSAMLPPAALASQQQASQPPPPVQNQHQQRPDQHPSYVDLKAYAAAAAGNSIASGVTGSGLLGSQPQRDSSSLSASTVAPPPGFSGPPSNMPAAAFTLTQPGHLSSLFQMPPTYHPQLNQLPFSFMLPNVTGSGQHKLGQHIFAQQTMDDSLTDQRHNATQQKVYSCAHQQTEKYVNSTGTVKDRLGGGAQATPPPQMYQQQPPQGYLPQQIPLHNKKTYGNGPQHWGAS